MKLTQKQVNRWFGRMIRHLSIKYGLPGLESEDLYQELLIQASEHEWADSPTPDRHHGVVLPVHPAHVNRFLSSRALDMHRQERQRARRRVSFESLPEAVLEQGPSTDEAGFLELRGILQAALPQQDFEIVMAKAFPPPEVEALAIRDQEEARAGREKGELRMHVHSQQPVVFDKHVAEFFQCGAATVSRAVTKARKVLEVHLDRTLHQRLVVLLAVGGVLVWATGTRRLQETAVVGDRHLRVSEKG